MKRLYILVSCIVIIFNCPAHNPGIFAQEPTNLKPSRPTLKVVAAPTDSIISISYTVPESSFVDLSISGAVGGVIAAPVFESRIPGEYTVKLNKKDWPQEVYSISITLDRDRKRRAAKRLIHHASDRQIDSSKELRQMWNQAMASSMYNPENAVEYWETLLNEHPDYENRGAAFLYSCMALMKVADSARVHAQIDSAVTWVPRSSVYEYVARFTNGLEMPPSYDNAKLYPSTALKYAKKAIDSVDDIAPPYRKHALCRYYYVKWTP